MTKVLRYALHAAIVLVPCALLLPMHGAFYSDWYNHLWHIAYYGQHLKAHASVPITLNTNPDLGMPTPLFYGFLFYPILGLVSTVLGPNLTVRLFVGALYLGQYLLTRATARHLGAPARVATALAWIALWAIYPMTNLYNRNALPEFFAVGLLTCAVLTWFQVLLATNDRERFFLSLRFGLCVCLAMGTHPITGLCSIPFLAVLVGASVLHSPNPRKTLACLPLPALLTVIVLGAWLFIIIKYNGHTVIATHGMAWVYYPFIDTFTTRLIPYDARVGTMPLSNISTPYLDATLNGPLFIFAIAIFYQVGKVISAEKRNRFLIPALLVVIEVFLFFLFASLDNGLTARLPFVFGLVQFGYRLISYQDLTMLTGALFVLYWFKQPIEVPRLLMIACVVLSMLGMAVKLTHVWPIRNFYGPLDLTTGLTTLPKTYNGFSDYELADLYQERFQKEKPEQLVAFKAESGARFAQWQPLALKLKTSAWVGTNIQVFPWAHFFVDGREVGTEKLGSYFQPHPDLATGLLGKNHLLIALALPAGEHTLDARIIPEQRWVWLRRLGYLMLVLWGAVCFIPVRWLTSLRMSAQTHQRSAAKTP